MKIKFYIKNLKSLALAFSLMISCVSDTKINSGEVEQSNSKSIVFDDNNDSYEELVIVTKPMSTTVSTTTTKSTTTTVTTTEPIDEYKDIRFLMELENNDLEIDELKLFILKYADYAKIDYDTALNVIKERLEEISTFKSIRGGIMCSLFDYAHENDLLLYHDGNPTIVEWDRDDKESLLIEFADNLCMSSSQKKVMLSSFRNETGHGESDYCVNYNNYGGIIIGDGYCAFSTPEFGIYYMAWLVNLKTEDVSYLTAREIFPTFAERYNPGNEYVYTQALLDMIGSVDEMYGDFSSENEKSYTLKK